MNITLTLRPIANGVIVNTERPLTYGDLGALGDNKSEWFFPTKEEAFDGLESIAAEAWQRAEEASKRTVRFRSPLRAFSEPIGGSGDGDEDEREQDGSAEPAVGTKLPEEEAATTGKAEFHGFNSEIDRACDRYGD